MKKWLKYSLFAFALLGAGLLVTIGVGTSTQTGTHWLITQAQYWVKGLTIESAEGSLLSDLKLKKVQYQQEGLQVEVGSVELVWRAMDLLSFAARVNRLHVNDVVVKVLPTPPVETKESSPFQLPEKISLPIRIFVEDAQVNHFKLELPDKAPIEIDNVTLVAHVDEQLHLTTLKVKSLAPAVAELNANGQVKLAKPYPITLELAAQSKLPDTLAEEIRALPIETKVKLNGDVDNLQMVMDLAQPVTSQLQATVKNALATPEWQVNLTLPQLAYPLKTAQTAQIELKNAQLTAQGTTSTYQATLNTHLQGQQIPAGDWDLALNGDLQHAVLERLNAKLLKGEASLNGAVTWSPALNAQVNLNTRTLNLTPFWKGWAENLGLDSQVSLNFDGKILTIQQFAAALPPTKAILNLGGTVDLSQMANPALNLNADWQALQYPLVPTVTEKLIAALPKGDVQITGTLDNYQVKLKTDLSGTDIPESSWQAQVSGNLQKAKIEQLNGSLLKGQLAATGTVQWQPDLTADLELNTRDMVLTPYWKEWAANHRLNTQISAKLADKQFNVSKLNITIPQIGSNINAKASGSIADLNNVTFDAALDWQKLRFPLVGLHPSVESLQGKVTAKGSTQAYQFTLDSQLTGESLPVMQIRSNGKGSLKDVQTTTSLNTLDGVAQLTAQAQWQPNVTWSAKLTGDRINLGRQFKDLPSKLAFFIQSDGQIKGSDLEATVDIKEFSGQLRNYPVKLKANAKAKNNRYEISQFNLQSGVNTIDLNATLTDSINANWKINAPNLAMLLPQAKGAIRGQGTVTGALSAPIVQADLNAEGAAFEDYRVDKLKLALAANLQNPNAPLTLDLEANSIKQGISVLANTVTLKANGSMNAHTLMLNAKTPQVSASTQLTGGLQLATAKNSEPRWQGTLQQLQATLLNELQQYGQWQLNAPAVLRLSASEIEVGRTCIFQAKTTHGLCVQAQKMPTSGLRLQGSIEHLPLTVATPEITGTLQGTFSANQAKDGIVTADMLLTISEGAFTTKIDDKVHSIKHQGGRITTRIDSNGLLSQLEFSLLDSSSGIQAQLKMPKFNRLEMNPDQRLEGFVRANFNDLSILPTFVPQISKATGRLNANLQIAGTVDEPLIVGDLKIQETDLDIPDFGLELRALNVMAISDKNSFGRGDLTASVRSGDGELKLIGSGDAIKQTAKFTLVGENFKAINNVEAYLVISPDLAIAYQDSQLTLTGKLTIPEANITPDIVLSDGSTSVGGVVKSSQDVVIIDPNNPNVETKISLPFKLAMDLNLILGQQVRVDAVGFKGHIGGALHLTNNTRQVDMIPIGNGELVISNGTFRSYGQDLQIDLGRVIFANVPVTKPELNIKAIRRIYGDDKVEMAGVHITGNPQRINLKLFTDPTTMPQDQILSYLFTGKKFDSNDKNRVLGLGTYILPNLYISYGVNLLDRTNVFSVRYNLNRKWGVEANISEKDKGIDVSYTLER